MAIAEYLNPETWQARQKETGDQRGWSRENLVPAVTALAGPPFQCQFVENFSPGGKYAR
jgi:hypothetical protein